MAAYERGLHEVGDGLFAYLQPDGSWGWSNAGLITSGDQSMLIDTLFDLKLTRSMLDEMARVSEAARSIDVLVNTHANGDHCWGNQLVKDARIIGTRRCAEEMGEVSPRMVATLVKVARLASRGGRPAKLFLRGLGKIGLAKLGAVGVAADFVVDVFGDFDFGGIELTAPSTTFDAALDVTVGDKDVSLIEVGPAHTRGDAIVHVPADGVVFSGDILFANAHPIMWEGPVQNWIDACRRIVELEPKTVVPGHGPVTTTDDVERLRGYFEYLRDEAGKRFEAGVPVLDAALDIDLGEYAGWADVERVVVNVESLYRELDPARPTPEPPDMFAMMARYRDRR